MSDLESILSDDPIIDEPIAEEDPQEEPTDEVTEPEAQPEPEAAAEPETEAEPKQVPLAALQDVRGDLRDVRARNEALEARLAAMQQQMQPQPVQQPAPDFYENPEAAVRHHITPVQQQMQNMHLDMSEEMTVTMLDAQGKDGRAVVGEAKAALQQAHASGNQAAVAAVMQAKNPYGELVKWHQQQKVMSEIGNDPEAWMARERERISAELQAQAVAQTVKETPQAPSLAAQPNLGTNAAPAWGGPPTLDEILNGK